MFGLLYASPLAQSADADNTIDASLVHTADPRNELTDAKALCKDVSLNRTSGACLQRSMGSQQLWSLRHAADGVM